MSGEAQHIVCPHCTSINRLPAGKPANLAKCGHCHQRLFDGRPYPASAESLAVHVKHNDIAVVVDFWADWCAPCKAMAPIYERVAAELEPRFRFLKVDTEAEQQLAARYQIRSIPTLMLFRKGEIVAQRAGAVDASTLRTWLQQYSA
jgi:thioredoxin 2